MRNRIMLLLGAALVITFGTVLQASAVANITSVSLGCSSFRASGTTTAAFVVFEVYDYATQSDLFFGSFPTNGSFDRTVSFPTQPTGYKLAYYVWGSPTADRTDWDGEDYYNETDTQTPCQQDSNPQGAKGIPAGFVMHTIICDTPVYNTAAGQPVGDAHITAGQTWFVNPTPVKGDDGKMWTEIYVSSTTNPFIPTVCVQ